MILQTILFGEFTPPPETGKRTYRIGFASAHRYIPPKPRVKPVRHANTSHVRMMELLKKSDRPMTSVELAPLIKMTRNHCGIILGALFKKGLVKRTKFVKDSTRYYRYTVKAETE